MNEYIYISVIQTYIFIFRFMSLTDYYKILSTFSVLYSRCLLVIRTMLNNVAITRLYLFLWFMYLMFIGNVPRSDILGS